ncbi:hypothetical protein [Paenibacillus sp. FSL R7-0026]|uniref:hypothetical protein n=1 Tax=Paenibacillus sp. FSL R7-0026 TaxID=2921668 RepID=UPI0030F581BF
MKYKYEYKTPEDREKLLNENSTLILIEEQNISDGNFLIFADEPDIIRNYVTVPEEEFEGIKQESVLLKAQSNALSERADFVEDVIAEMATQVYK